MKKHLHIIKNSRLFAGITEGEIEAMLQCLSAAVKIYKKGDIIYRAGENISSVAMLSSKVDKSVGPKKSTKYLILVGYEASSFESINSSSSE